MNDTVNMKRRSRLEKAGINYATTCTCKLIRHSVEELKVFSRELVEQSHFAHNEVNYHTTKVGS